jgi:hypothetical protein
VKGAEACSKKKGKEATLKTVKPVDDESKAHGNVGKLKTANQEQGR